MAFFLSSSRSRVLRFFGDSVRSHASISRWTDRTPFDGVLHVVDEAPLDRFGELDPPDVLRDLDLRAHRRPAGAAVLPLVACRRALRRVGELLVELFVRRARLADGIDLLLHLTPALFDPLVSDLFVVEDDQFANRPLAGVQLIPELDDLLGHQRRPGDRLDHRELAALDAPRNLHFALAGEQRHRAHLAQIHAHGIVGLVERAGREVELELFGPFGRAVDDLVVAQVFLIGVDDFDTRAAEGVEQIVELVGRGDFRRQQLVHLVIQQVAFLLADADELSYFVVLFLDREVIPYVSSSMRWSRSFFRCHKLSISCPCWLAPSC